MLYWVLVVGVPATVCLLMWLAYLIFLVRLAGKHGPEAMRDAAEAVKVFPGVGLAAAIARALRPYGPAEVAGEIVREASQVLWAGPAEQSTEGCGPPEQVRPDQDEVGHAPG